MDDAVLDRVLVAQDFSPARSTRREPQVVAVLVILLVLFRCLVFLVWEQAYFDSDQAITGLMAKHISQGRAFPLFFYGQNYLLELQAWLAAPIFLVAGVSNTTLKIPLVAINLAIALLLLRTLHRDVGLRPIVALVPILFFVLPAPGTAATFLLGGSIEPFLYVLLIWVTRKRPIWCGLVLGLGVLQREFTLYGLLALLLIEIVERSLFTREGMRRKAAMMVAAAGVWFLVQWLKGYSTPEGPGTTLADIYTRGNVGELIGRLCLDFSAVPRGAWRMLTSHWPALFGLQVQPVAQFGIEGVVNQGLNGAWPLLAATALIPLIVIPLTLGTERRWRPEYGFPAYLILVGFFSSAGYVVGRCGAITLILMRYDLMSILGMVGLGALFLRVTRSAIMRRLWIACALSCVAIAVLGNGRLLRKYLVSPPFASRRLIVDSLEARGIKYGISDYWIAYAVTFLSNERIIMASNTVVRIKEYNRIVDEHRAEAVRISRDRCDNGWRLTFGLYVCPP